MNSVNPIVACLCGSTRFGAELEFVAQCETLAGCIVVRPEVIMRELDPRHRVTDPVAVLRFPDAGVMS